MTIISEPFFSKHLRLLEDFTESLNPYEEKILVTLMMSDDYNDFLFECIQDRDGSGTEVWFSLKKRFDFTKEYLKKNNYGKREDDGVMKILSMIFTLFNEEDMKRRVAPIQEKYGLSDENVKDFFELVDLPSTIPIANPPEGVTVLSVNKDFMDMLWNEHIKMFGEQGCPEQEQVGFIVTCKNAASQKDTINYIKTQWNKLGIQSKTTARKNPTLKEKLIIADLYESALKQKEISKSGSDWEEPMTSAWEITQASLGEDYEIEKDINTLTKAYQALKDMRIGK